MRYIFILCMRCIWYCIRIIIYTSKIIKDNSNIFKPFIPPGSMCKGLAFSHALMVALKAMTWVFFGANAGEHATFDPKKCPQTLGMLLDMFFLKRWACQKPTANSHAPPICRTSKHFSGQELGSCPTSTPVAFLQYGLPLMNCSNTGGHPLSL